MNSDTDRYERLSNENLISLLRCLQDEFETFLHYGLGYTKGQYLISGLDIIDAIIREDKREKYFRYFHNGMKINECKKAALFAYWIIKLRPIKIIDNGLINNVERSAKVNEKVAVNHLLKALVGVGQVKLWDGHDGVNFDKDNEFLKELHYSFRFRNFTIDSMIVLADAITTESFL